MTNNLQLTTHNGEEREKRVVCRLSFVVSQRSGQSLIEVVVGLGIGALLIGAGAFSIFAMLRSNVTTEKYRAASGFSQELIDTARSFAGASWQSIYGLAKGSGTTYYLNATGTTYFVVNGQEGMLDNDVRNGLVGEWKFDEDAASTSTTTYDATGNNYHGTLVGAPTRASSTCKIANCIYLDGTDDQISLGGGTGYDTASFSVSLWMRPVQFSTSHYGGDPNENIFMARENYTVSGFRAGVSGAPATAGRIHFWTTQSGGTLTLNSGTSRISTSTSAFYHVVVTYSSSTNQGNIYLDGTVVSSSTGSYVPPAGRTLAIDGGTGGVWYLNTYVDDFRWYNRVLSADEVKRLHNSGIFKRFFAVENVCRTNDASSTIAGTAPCSGTSEDASTEQITVHAQWTAGAGTGEAKMTSFLTRARNAVFQQTDWSGGSGASGAYTAAPTTYASGTNVSSSTPGSIQILNLTQQ